MAALAALDMLDEGEVRPLRLQDSTRKSASLDYTSAPHPGPVYRALRLICNEAEPLWICLTRARRDRLRLLSPPPLTPPLSPLA